MTPENKSILDDLRHFHTSLSGPAQTLRGLNQHQKNDLVNAGKEFFGPKYSPDLWCPTCVGEMIMRVYGAYDKLLNDQSLTVCTGFPSHLPGINSNEVIPVDPQFVKETFI